MNGTPLSPGIQAELARLHDIRLPDPVGWWPPAPGWWALLALALAAAALMLWHMARLRRSARYLALRELDDIRSRMGASQDPRRIAVDLAVLIRRVALETPERAAVARLSGSAWAHHLSGGGAGLSAPVAGLLANAPYARFDPVTDLPLLQAATDEAEPWIRRHT